MTTRPGPGGVLNRAVVIIGAVGGATLCFRAARLLAVALALGLKKCGRGKK